MVIILVLIALALAIGLIYATFWVMIPTCIRAIKRYRAIETDQDRAEFRAWMHTSINRSAREGK